MASRKTGEVKGEDLFSVWGKGKHCLISNLRCSERKVASSRKYSYAHGTVLGLLYLTSGRYDNIEPGISEPVCG